MIAVGDRVPGGALQEYVSVETEACSIGPRAVAVSEELAGKTVAIFGLPGAFTPTCSASHLPGYIGMAEALRSAGVSEIWCVSVNDAFVMGAWGREQRADGKVRLLADGSAVFTQALGLVLDLTSRGMGLRSQRYSMLVVDGTVRTLNVEGPGRFEVSDAKTMLAQASEISA